MSKSATFPTLLNACKKIKISDLSRWGYLAPNQYKSGVINWSRNGTNSGSISIATNTSPESPCLELDYKTNGNTIGYRIPLVSVPSNIGKGVVWYFLCPQTIPRFI
jgi:hypothetical protein